MASRRPEPAADARPVDPVRAGVGQASRDQQLRWFLALAGVLILLSLFSGGLFLYAVVVIVVVYLVAIAVTLPAQHNLQVWRYLSTEEVELGAEANVRVIVQNQKAFPAFWLFWHDRLEAGLDAEGARADFKTLHPGAKEKLMYRLHTTRRGLFRIGPLVTEASDPLGLISRFRVDDQASFLTVLPRPVPMGQGWPLGHKPIHQIPRRRSLFEDPSRFSGIRAFRTGDSLRRVHWRATARSGELQVKTFEPSVLDGALLALEMCAAAYPSSADEHWAGVEPNEELVITTAVSIGKFVLDGGQSVGLLANGADAAERYPVDWQGGSFRRLEEALDSAGEGSRRVLEGRRPVELGPAKGPLQWQRLRIALARLTRARGPRLGELLDLELPWLPRSMVLVVVTPELDPALVSALTALRRSGLEIAVVWVNVAHQATESIDRVGPSGWPRSIPLYGIRQAADLEQFGNARL